MLQKTRYDIDVVYGDIKNLQRWPFETSLQNR